MSWFSLICLLCLGFFQKTHADSSLRRDLGWQDTLDEIRDHESSADRLREKLKEQMRRRNRKMEEEFALHLKKQRDNLLKQQKERRKQILETMKRKFAQIARLEERRHELEEEVRKQRARIARARHRLHQAEEAISPTSRKEFQELKRELHDSKEHNRKEMSRFMKRARRRFQFHMKERAKRMKEIMERLSKCKKKGDLEKVARLLDDADRKGRSISGRRSSRRYVGYRRSRSYGDGSRSYTNYRRSSSSRLSGSRGSGRDMASYRNFDDVHSTVKDYNGHLPKLSGRKYRSFRHDDDLTHGFGKSSRSRAFRSSSMSPSFRSRRQSYSSDSLSGRRLRSSRSHPPEDIFSDVHKKSSVKGSLDYSPNGITFQSKGKMADHSVADAPKDNAPKDKAPKDKASKDKETWVDCDDPKASYSSRQNGGPCDHSPVDFTSSYGKRALEAGDMAEETAEAETAASPAGESEALSGSASESASADDENKLFKFLTHGNFN